MKTMLLAFGSISNADAVVVMNYSKKMSSDTIASTVPISITDDKGQGHLEWHLITCIKQKFVLDLRRAWLSSRKKNLLRLCRWLNKYLDKSSHQNHKLACKRAHKRNALGLKAADEAFAAS